MSGCCAEPPKREEPKRADPFDKLPPDKQEKIRRKVKSMCDSAVRFALNAKPERMEDGLDGKSES